MSEHASDLRLDELAAGVPGSEQTRSHVSGCSTCSERLRQIEAARSRAKGSVGFHVVKARLRASPPKRRWTWKVIAAPALAVATSVVIVLMSQLGFGTDFGTRIKGGFSIAAVTAGGDEVRRARPGDQLQLTVGSVGRTHVLVLGVDAQGAVDVVWPPDGKESGEVLAGASARLTPSFEVTPGSVALYAFFANIPIPARPVKSALGQEILAAGSAGRGPLDARPPKKGPWDGVVKLVLEVGP